MSLPLVLVPTPGERQVLRAALGEGPRIELCGFGPIVAAARTASLVREHRPSRVLLAGIAGRFGEQLAIGSAHRFAEVACHGVGVGSAAAFQPATAVGWAQWPAAAGNDSAIGDLLACDPGTGSEPLPAGLLLTACAASASAADVADRRRLFPAAVAEDMEGFGVAVACRLAGVPLEIIRGISNDAGDRDHGRWHVEPALEAAAAVLRTRLACAS